MNGINVYNPVTVIYILSNKTLHIYNITDIKIYWRYSDMVMKLFFYVANFLLLLSIWKFKSVVVNPDFQTYKLKYWMVGFGWKIDT